VQHFDSVLKCVKEVTLAVHIREELEVYACITKMVEVPFGAVVAYTFGFSWEKFAAFHLRIVLFKSSSHGTQYNATVSASVSSFRVTKPYYAG
jgi:hypothetical protein